MSEHSQLPSECVLPLFPLPGFTLFPGTRVPLHVFEPRYRQLVADVLDKDRLLALPQLKPGYEPSYYGHPEVFAICGVGRIVEHVELPDGRYNVLVEGIGRVRLIEEASVPTAYRSARFERLDEHSGSAGLVVSALATELQALCGRLEKKLPALASVQAIFKETNTAGGLADRVAAALVADPAERQSLLDELDPAVRLERLIAHLYEVSSALPGGKSERELN
ncbi:MAG: LON peptidase substrate-binding domain-containing protein [Myxococcota bacterium]|nr:LON peptidase substrate-binding domain-containing protein [Myxococcota bacterium]